MAVMKILVYVLNLLHPHQIVFWTVWRDPCFHLKINTNSYSTFRLMISFYATCSKGRQDNLKIFEVASTFESSCFSLLFSWGRQKKEVTCLQPRYTDLIHRIQLLKQFGLPFSMLLLRRRDFALTSTSLILLWPGQKTNRPTPSPPSPSRIVRLPYKGWEV